MYRKRLKTVYELLEAGNNKKVIQEVDKLLQTAQTKTTKKSAPTQQQLQQQQQQSDGPIYDEESVQVIAKALKSLALVRTNRKQEADKLIDELLDSNTTDENALSIVMQYCKETQQLFKIVTFYENAVVKCENDPKLVRSAEHEEILSSLFYAHLRNRDFLKQQQIALKLYKQTNKMMFCFWNAASYVMMSKLDSPQVNQQQKGMYLQLGEKILQKAYEDQKMEYNGEFLLYLNILEERSKFEQALEIVSNFDEEKNASKLGVNDFKVKKKILYLKQLKRWSDLRKCCELHLAHVSNANLDDWLTYLAHLDVLMELFNELKETDDFIEGVIAFYKLLIDRIEIKKENGAEGTKAQGPYLARIEFLSRLYTQTNDSTSIIPQLKEFFQSYIRMFACKPGFYFDLIYFKKLIAKLDLSEFVLNELKQLHDSNRPFNSVKSIYTCLSYWQMNRFFGKQFNLSSADLLKLAIDFEQMYVEALEFGKDLLATSFQYADEFLIMACHLRYDLYKRDPQSYSLLQLIVNLKHGLTQSPSNYQLKLLLLNLYSHLGAYESLQSMYDSMEIKNIQNYSTANLLLIHNIRLGALSPSYNTYMSMNQFFTSNLFDMANFLVYCFKYGTFLKAIEIYSFMNTICKSLTLNLCLTNTAAIQFAIHPLITTPEPTEPDTDPILNEFRSLQFKLDTHLKEIANVSTVFDSNGLLPDDNSKLSELLLDHNDKNVLYQWEPEDQDQLAHEQYNLILNEQRRLLKLRNLLVRYTDNLLKLWLLEPQQQQQTDLNSKYDLYKTKLNDFSFESLIKNEQEFDLKLKIYVTKSNYFSRFSELGLDKLLNLVINLSSDLCQNDSFLNQEQQNQQKTLVNYRDQLKQTCETIKQKLETLINDMKTEFKIEKVTRVLESLTASLETISYVSVVFTACLSSHKLKPIWSEKMKKSKKKKGQYAQYAQSIDLVADIYEQLVHFVSFYSYHLRHDLCANISGWTQSMLTNQQSTIKLNYTPNLNDLTQSYLKSFDELKANFNFKLKYLSKFASNTAILSQIVENLKLN